MCCSAAALRCSERCLWPASDCWTLSGSLFVARGSLAEPRHSPHTLQAAMVVKTELCSFSGLRIYPGHGIQYVRTDQKGFRFLNRKAKSYFLQRFNPRKIAWTQLYRRMHKKGTLEESTKKKVCC